MKILITGANGFVGKHLCLKLLSKGHTVYGLVRNPATIDFTHPNFHLIKGSLQLGLLPWVDQLPSDLDTCIHSAGLVHAYNTNDFFRVNTLGTKFLIESLKNKFPLKFKFILISSLAAAGPLELGFKKDETDIDFPVSEYGRSKKEAEVVLKDLAPESWIISIVRPPMIIGPGDTAVLDIFKMVKLGCIILPGTNSKIKEYSFVCVFDLVETICKLTDSDFSLFVYSAHESTIKFQELIKEIKTQLKKSWILYIPIPLPFIKVLGFFLNTLYKIYAHNLRLTPDKINELKAISWTCDASLSKSALNQVYQYDLRETVAVTLKDYKDRQWI